jgi:polyhydroxyalkanoate synthesis regulator phasin
MPILLLALLVLLLPFSQAAATPPPQGWEERVKLPSQLPAIESRLEAWRRILVSHRDRVQRLEGRLNQLNEDERRVLDAARRRVQTAGREIEELEEEVARIKESLGIKP